MFAGIQKKDGYLSELNTKVLWLSAVLQSEASNDRAILNYKELDKKFGTVETLKGFCKKLLKEGECVAHIGQFLLVSFGKNSNCTTTFYNCFKRKRCSASNKCHWD